MLVVGKREVQVRFGESVFTYVDLLAGGGVKNGRWFIEINELNEGNVDVCKGLENLWDATDRLGALNRLQREINAVYNKRFFKDHTIWKTIAEAEAFLREVEGKTYLAESLLVLKEGQVSDYKIFVRNRSQSVNWIDSLIDELKTDLKDLKEMANA